MARTSKLAALLARCTLAWLLCGLAGTAPAQTTNPAPPATALLDFSGTVEVAAAGTADWRPAARGQPLRPGDRLRTRADSRATLRLSDKSAVRINQSSVVEIQAPTGATARKKFKLQSGSLFFLNRERPGDIEFETPLATGAIRGTEFLLSANEADGTTSLNLIDGAVELRAGPDTASLTNGQQAIIRPGQPPAVSAALPVVNLMQWCFYYPGVLNPTDLALTDAEKSTLARSLAAYRDGDLLAARASLPENFTPDSDATRVYAAALKLAVGQVESADDTLSSMASAGPLVSALWGVILSVKFQEWKPAPALTTSSEWLANSYYLQSRSRLDEALAAAKKSAELAPDFGFAWARVAELEFGFGRHAAARRALNKARQLSPRHAQAVALEGFIALAQNHARLARLEFDQALALDGSLASAWLGRALAHEQLGQAAEGRADLQTAAALEPHRALYRSYLGKAWGQSGEDRLADKDFALAQQFDPADPTAWLYSALHKHQTHRLNDAVRDLERSVELNDNRSVFRSRQLLDQDRAIRSADLAALYDSVGLTEVGERAAARAVQDDYANFSGHLFLARSLEAREDRNRFDLRLETPRQSELLIANLLAPPGGGNLSQLRSQQEHLDYFGARPVGFSSFTEYRSHGDWQQEGSVFGTVGRLSYAVDGYYLSLNGQQPNGELERFGYSLQAKAQFTTADSFYVQVGYAHSDSGDVAQHYDPATSARGFNAEETQEAFVHVGYHHEWAPGIHTLFLGSRLPDRLSVTNPQPGPLFVHYSGGAPYAVERDPFFSEDFHSRFTLYSAELQQIFENPHHAFIFGGRYQFGTVENEALLTRSLSGVVTDQSLEEDLHRASAYGYYQWRPVTWVNFTAGVSYDWIEYPRNLDAAPLSAGTESASQVSPKLGLTINPWQGGHFRAAWARSLGGLYFDESTRLEPVQVAGFANTFRSLIPESVVGLVAGTEFETWGVGFDQQFDTGTYLGVTAELLTSEGRRTVGAFTNSTFIQEPDAATSAQENLDFEERSISAYVSQLLGRHWATGARYRITEGDLDTRYPGLASVPGVGNVQHDESSTLQHAQLFLRYNHECGFFGEWSSDWYHQDNEGQQPATPGDAFWQHSVFIGYRFPRRRAELRFGALNLTDEDYRLGPLNLHDDLARQRTFVTSLRISF